MTCDEALVLLSACTDGELSGFERGVLRAHLGQCDTCLAVHAELEALKAGTMRLTAPPAPPELRSAVSIALKQGRTGRAFWAFAMTARGRMPRFTEGEREWTHTRTSHPAYHSRN